MGVSFGVSFYVLIPASVICSAYVPYRTCIYVEVLTANQLNVGLIQYPSFLQ
jgi:hypothetical protein